ncbi:MAG: beta-propeller domain-containing protein [Bacilli bacterium]|nr:beta-propeller domain-containing protein [Bacilli bacterium]
MDDFEKKIRESKECIEESKVSSSKDIYKMAKSASPKGPSIKKAFTPKLVIKYAIIVLAFLLMFTGGFFLSKGLNKNSDGKEKIIYRSTVDNNNVTINYDDVEEKTTPLSFSSFNSQEELVSYLADNRGAKSTANGDESAGWYSIPTAQAESVMDGDSAKANSSSSYQTNTQVENVDEADVVKVKGNHIFYITNTSNSKKSACYMYTEVDGELELTKEIEFSEQIDLIETKEGYELVKITRTTPMDLYVTDKYLVLRINKYEYKSTRYINISTLKYNYSGSYDHGYTCMFQIYDVETLDLITTIDTAGTNVSTRLIDNTLYIVNNYYDYMYNDNKFYFYPYFYVGDKIYYPYISNIYCCEGSEAKTYVSIYKVTLGDEINIEDLHILTPTVNNIYSSMKNIYLIRSYGSTVIKEEDYQLSYSNSRVVVVNIEDALTLSGSFDVKGSINDKYWIDEKDEYIRVVTTGYESKHYYFDQKYFYKYESSVFNFLTIFKKTEDGFIESGSIKEGLGKPGETVRSARFNGDVVTIVTFKNTDPIYYVDISDPENPVITSSLEITGYSVYQHPYKDNYVIGFGYDGSRWSDGFKITLFDVSDKTNIKQVGKSLVIKSNVTTWNGNESYYNLNYSTPEFFNNPKALFVDNELGIFGFRLVAYNYYYYRNGYLSNGNPQYDYDSKKSTNICEYLVLTIDETSEEPIKMITLAKEERSRYVEYNDYNYQVSRYFKRLVFIGNNYYLLSPFQVNTYKRDGFNFEEGNKIYMK